MYVVKELNKIMNYNFFYWDADLCFKQWCHMVIAPDGKAERCTQVRR